MKKSLVLLPLFALALCSCVKTAELYPDDAYCHTEFDLNYYTEWNNVDTLKINTTKTVSAIVAPPQEGLSPSAVEFGNKNKLTSIDTSFAYGYLSKLKAFPESHFSARGYAKYSSVSSK